MHVEFIPACLRCPQTRSLNQPCLVERSHSSTPPFTALFCLFHCMVPILPAINRLVSSGINSVGNTFNMANS